MLHVASGIYPLTFSSPSPVTNKNCFLLFFSLLLVKAAFRLLQTLGAVPAAGFLLAASFYETKENAKWFPSADGKPLHFFLTPLQTPLPMLFLGLWGWHKRVDPARSLSWDGTRGS